MFFLLMNLFLVFRVDESVLPFFQRIRKGINSYDIMIISKANY